MLNLVLLAGAQGAREPRISGGVARARSRARERVAGDHVAVASHEQFGRGTDERVDAVAVARAETHLQTAQQSVDVNGR